LFEVNYYKVIELIKLKTREGASAHGITFDEGFVLGSLAPVLLNLQFTSLLAKFDVVICIVLNEHA
jgi:hypothetical protein